jgi:hypothetical protein
LRQQIPTNWDLWVHLFCGELHTLATDERRTRRAVRAGGLTLALRDTRKELYPLCTMTSNNMEWEKGWFYLRNDGVGLPPYTGKVLKGKPDAWFHSMSPPHGSEGWSPSLPPCDIWRMHHRRVIPLMERELRIFEMSDVANPTSLAHSRLL